MRLRCWLAFLSIFPFLAACTAAGEAAEPLSSGIERANFDPSVRFQDDLFRAVNGAWLAKTKIPADRGDYGAFTALAEQAEKDVRAIIENCAGAGQHASDTDRKIGDLYASYMDQSRADRLGVEPIAGTLAAIDKIETKAALAQMLGELERIGVGGVVNCSIGPDAKRSDQYILHLSQAGLGLPDRDYYSDAKYKEKLAAYGCTWPGAWRFAACWIPIVPPPRSWPSRRGWPRHSGRKRKAATTSKLTIN